MRNRLRVGIYSAQYPGISGAGGIATYTRSLATGLTELGHEVHVLTLGTGEPCEVEGVHIHFVKARHLPLLERVYPGVRETFNISMAARTLCKDFNLDVFEFPNWEGRGAYFNRLPGARPAMVVRMHTSCREILEIEDAQMTRAQRFECKLEHDCCMAADALYVSTAAHRRHMATELGIPASKIDIVPLGIPDVSNPKAREQRPRGKPRTLLYLGRLEKRKGVVDLLQAMPEIVRSVPDVQLVLIGKDREHAPGNISHQEYFACNFPPELQKHVIFAGFLEESEINHWFERADAFVAPSIYESFGLIFIEAMRWSLPVIGTHAGGIPEVVEDGLNGYLVNPRAPHEIAARVVEILTDEPLRLRMAASARQTFEKKFTSRVMAARTAEHFRHIISGSAEAAKIEPSVATVSHAPVRRHSQRMA